MAGRSPAADLHPLPPLEVVGELLSRAESRWPTGETEGAPGGPMPRWLAASLIPLDPRLGGTDA